MRYKIAVMCQRSCIKIHLQQRSHYQHCKTFLVFVSSRENKIKTGERLPIYSAATVANSVWLKLLQQGALPFGGLGLQTGKQRQSLGGRRIHIDHRCLNLRRDTHPIISWYIFFIVMEVELHFNRINFRKSILLVYSLSKIP